MTQERRINDKHPARPLDWENTEPLAGQQWRAPVDPANAKVDLSGLQRYDLSTDHAFWVVPREAGQLLLWADVERLLTAPAGAAAAPLLMDERQAFEHWAGANSFYLKEMPELNKRGPASVYYNARTQQAWEGWQARATLGAYPSPKLPEGGGALTNGEIIEIAHKARAAESRDGDYILPISFARAIEVDVQRRCRAQRTNNEVSRDAAPVNGNVLAVVRRLLDGSQPKDVPGAIAVIDAAFGKGGAWAYDLAPPPGFADYVRANYSGDIHTHDPEWHALRLWNAAMKNAKPPFIEVATPARAPAPAGGDAWISVDERLPEVGQEVLIWCGYRTLGSRSHDKHDPENHNGWVIDFDNGQAKSITHWMPLPQAPSAPVSSGVVGEATGHD